MKSLQRYLRDNRKAILNLIKDQGISTKRGTRSPLRSAGALSAKERE